MDRVGQYVGKWRRRSSRCLTPDQAQTQGHQRHGVASCGGGAGRLRRDRLGRLQHSVHVGYERRRAVGEVHRRTEEVNLEVTHGAGQSEH